ncbi:hypothetical protein [Nocardioides massiliensis]|uniref:hypothetical protein n=1 Tax=Nocardioides massiliensis TaxID=1325935 RepID=UPI001C678951|nr:hypothetical protein [Nocardioides massiliensis]
MRHVVREIVQMVPSVAPETIMLVGATCRDILHSALGFDWPLRATNDLDLAFAMADWADYSHLTSRLTPMRDAANGVRYAVAGVPVDLMPFGRVEDPAGIVTPRGRGEAMSVWAFREVYAGAMNLRLDPNTQIRVPSIPGYAALKLCAWLDRAGGGQYKDAADLATVLYWFANSDALEERLYSSDAGNAVLLEHEMDLSASAAHLLGQDIRALLGPERHNELRARWPDARRALLISELTLPVEAQWPRDHRRRSEIVAAMESGLELV